GRRAQQLQGDRALVVAPGREHRDAAHADDHEPGLGLRQPDFGPRLAVVVQRPRQPARVDAGPDALPLDEVLHPVARPAQLDAPPALARQGVPWPALPPDGAGGPVVAGPHVLDVVPGPAPRDEPVARPDRVLLVGEVEDLLRLPEPAHGVLEALAALPERQQLVDQGLAVHRRTVVAHVYPGHVVALRDAHGDARRAAVDRVLHDLAGER